MRINLQKIANPYIVFSIAWLLCLGLYSLGWAEIFPPISSRLFIFLSCFIVLFAVTGFLFNKVRTLLSNRNSTALNRPLVLRYKALFIVNALLYATNFLYSGIPLINGTRDSDFGIPTIIVISTTLNAFTSVYCFYLFLQTSKKRFILYSLCCLGFFMLAFSRGNTMMSLVTMFFLWINVKHPALTFKKLLGIVTGILLVMYLFGVAGNYRTINELYNKDASVDKTYNSNVILALGGASDSFKSGFIPDEFFWTYLYLTSPLSNLQYDINKNSPPLTLQGLEYVLIDELMFDTISKRIDDFLNRKRADPDLLVEQLTVPTTLAGSYNYAGWGGMIFFMIVYWLFPLIYMLTILKNPLGVIGISTLCTVYFFSIFDNMFILTGLTFQILYPIILNYVNKINFKPALT